MIPQFNTRKELFEWLRENKSLLVQAKKAAIKQADPVYCVSSGPEAKGTIITKELGADAGQPSNGILYVKSVINTTNLMDSHSDVHIPGIWKKSLQETKIIYHLQEHNMTFDKVISDDVTAYTKSMSWKSLGYDFEGNTQALVFDSTIKAARNPFMFDQYANGYVKNHSVGMRYIKLFLALDSDNKYDAEEKANWDKYIADVINKDAAVEQGYFWAVTEAKVIEGSAVLVGSNVATPTLSVSEAGFKSTLESSQIEPVNTTQPDYSFLKDYKVNSWNQTK